MMINILLLKIKKILGSYDSYAQAYRNIITKEKIGTFMSMIFVLQYINSFKNLYFRSEQYNTN